MSKKVICLIVTVIMVASVFTACGKQSVTLNSSSSSSAVSASTVEPVKDPNQDPFTLTIASWTLDTDASKSSNKSTIDFLAAVEKMFKNKYPNAKIELHNTGGDKYGDILKAKLASNSVEDIFMWQEELAPLSTIGKNNYAVDLSDQPWAANILDMAKPSVMYQGKLLAAPYDFSGWGSWYNKKIFSDNQIQIPKTYADFLAVCAALKAKGITPLVGGFKDTWTAGGWGIIGAGVFIMPTYPDFMKNVYNGTEKLNSPAYAKIFTSFQDLIEKGYYNKNILSIGWDQSRQEFEKGNAAMIIQGSWMPGVVASEVKDFPLGFMPIPDEKGGVIMQAIGGNYTSISTGSKLINQAKDYIIAMLDKGNITIRLNDTAYPAFKGYDIKYTNPASLEYLQAFQNNKTALQFNAHNTGSLNTDITNELIRIASGKKFDPKDLDKFDTDYQNDKSQVVPW